jgi:hypothetical protein
MNRGHCYSSWSGSTHAPWSGTVQAFEPVVGPGHRTGLSALEPRPGLPATGPIDLNTERPLRHTGVPAAAGASAAAVTAASMSPTTASGCETIATWLAAASIVSASTRPDYLDVNT